MQFSLQILIIRALYHINQGSLHKRRHPLLFLLISSNNGLYIRANIDAMTWKGSLLAILYAP
jgi:hypothetical protein